MNNFSVKNRIKKLRDEISRLGFLYHVKDEPEVNDDIYDSLNNELKKLLKKYPEFIDLNAPENRIGGEPLKKFKKVHHNSRMFSMNDIFNEGEVKDWEVRISKLIKETYSYFCELKLDGLSASLIYENGVFIRGATRGNGLIGEDVTLNLKMIETIPLKLNAPYPEYLEVRGEVIMTKKALISLNKRQKQLAQKIFANTRNAAAGTLRQLDSKIVKERKLDFFAWELIDLKSNNNKINKIVKHSEKHDYLKRLGFQVAPYEKKAKDINEVFLFINKIAEIRNNLPYGTDGIVISVDQLDLQKRLGTVGKAPRYMIAFKYQAERATTQVTDITVNVGRTGVLTPLAHFNPTLVAGSIVSKATLHNMDQINRLDIRVGDTIVIQKAGDVIPEVVETLTKLRTGQEKKFEMPKFCPICNSKVERKELSKRSVSLRKKLERDKPLKNQMPNSVAFYCTNRKCPARDQRSLEHFINVFEIYEIGPKIIKRLKDEGLISDAADFFSLEKVDLSGLERFGEKSADNIISSIKLHKKVLFWRFIYALGIIHVGEQTAQDLASHFSSLEKIMKASVEDIVKIENIGPIVAKSVFEFFNNKVNLIFINKLLKNGVVIINDQAKSEKLDKKVFVLTGTLENLSREEAKKIIIKNGGKVSSSVSSKTTYLLVGDDPGSKYKKAKKLGIKILSEDEFIKLIK